MNVLPIYIDDWLSSPSVDDMDAQEERGYFRLCLHAAKLEFDGLPNDERQLANWSRLGAQWNKLTRDQRFRSAMTSGQKILQNFYERDGRLFNAKVLKCVEQYRERQDQAKKAARKRWAPDDASAMPEHMREHSGSNPTRVGSESEQIIQTLSGEGVEGGQRWCLLLELAARAKMAIDPSPDSQTRKRWNAMPFDEQIAAAIGIKERIDCGQYEDPQYVPSLDNYLRFKKWRESLRPRAGPRLVDGKSAARDEFNRRMARDLERGLIVAKVNTG